MLRKLTVQIKNATRYSFDGCNYMLRNEFAARVEVYAYFWMMVALICLKASGASLMILTVLFLIMLAVEALNTAIEVIMDRVSPEISPAGKRAKDLGSFAVFCMIAVNGLFFVWALFQTEAAARLMDGIFSAAS